MKCKEKSHRRNQANLQETDRLYFGLYAEYGADILDGADKYNCNLLLLPQYSFDPDRIRSIAHKNIIMLGAFSYGGYYLKEFRDVGGHKFWTYDEKVFNELTKVRNQESILNDLEISTFALPFTKYPALDFSNLKIDYLIAHPTRLFLKDNANRMKFYSNMRRLLRSIPKEKTIFIKDHNVRDAGNDLVNGFMDRNKILIKNILQMAGSIGLSVSSKLESLKKISEKQYKWRAAVYKFLIEREGTFLSSKTKYHNFNIEHFLPFVREGVITGISSVIWNSLYEQVPVYNCDDQPLTDNLPNYDVIKDFYVSSCHSRLDFDAENFALVRGPDMNNDMIEMIKSEVGSYI
ncbi:MAG: hypothetical protein V3U02_04765 [Calditrichia bacterium]